MKTLLRWLMPSPQKIADMTADAFQKVVNDKLADQKEYIIKGSLVSERIMEVQESLTKWLADGHMSDDEKSQLSNALRPLIDTVLAKL